MVGRITGGGGGASAGGFVCCAVAATTPASTRPRHNMPLRKLFTYSSSLSLKLGGESRDRKIIRCPYIVPHRAMPCDTGIELCFVAVTAQVWTPRPGYLGSVSKRVTLSAPNSRAVVRKSCNQSPLRIGGSSTTRRLQYTTDAARPIGRLQCCTVLIQ